MTVKNLAQNGEYVQGSYGQVYLDGNILQHVKQWIVWTRDKEWGGTIECFIPGDFVVDEIGFEAGYNNEFQISIGFDPHFYILFSGKIKITQIEFICPTDGLVLVRYTFAGLDDVDMGACQ